MAVFPIAPIANHWPDMKSTKIEFKNSFGMEGRYYFKLIIVFPKTRPGPAKSDKNFKGR